MADKLTFAVPVEWDGTRTYENKMIVFIGKRAFTALQDVPAGIEISNTTYWAETGVPFLDVESIRQSVTALSDEVDSLTGDVTAIDGRVTTNSNNIATLTSQLSTAVSQLSSAAATIDNIMVSLYTPYPAESE
jgi:hypothetical protein